MFYILKFNLQKCEGNFPTKEDLSTIFPESNYKEIIKSHLRFSFNNDNNLLPVIEWKLVDDGLKNLPRVLAGLDKGLKPIIWLKLDEEVDIEDNDVWVDALSSEYVLSIPGINNDESFYFQDHNGYSKIESAEWLADDLWEELEEIVRQLKNKQVLETDFGLVFKHELKKNGEEYVISLSFDFNSVHMTFEWLFESELFLDGFDYYDKIYSDSDNCNCIEENSKILEVHSIICKK
jgi:hypothetical protein